jgi:hypothetical protein
MELGKVARYSAPTGLFLMTGASVKADIGATKAARASIEVVNGFIVEVREKYEMNEKM